MSETKPKRFTAKEYEEYKNRPYWKRDEDADLKFDSENEYLSHLAKCVDRWLSESRAQYKVVKTEWAYAIRRFESFVERMHEMSSARADPASTQLPFVYKAVLELVALLFDSLPRPKYQSRQASEDDFAAALNYYADWEMDANGFDLLMYDVGLDIQLTNIGIIKTTIDPEKTGPFGKSGRVDIRRIEPRFFHPDPLASGVDWEKNRFWIFTEYLDIAEIRSRYPLTGHAVKPEASAEVSRSDAGPTNQQEEQTPHIMMSPSNALGYPESTVGTRGRAVIKECWLHDDTEDFVADYQWVDEGPDGPGRDELVLDDDGYVVGEWKKRYPAGRVIVTCNGHVLLDIANPYRHKQPPYVIFKGRPTKSVLAPGEATFLTVVDRKLNDIYIRVMRMAQANIERPTRIDRNAFDAPKKWSRIDALADTILPVTPNAQIAPVVPGEIPQFVPLFAQFLRNFFDDLMGVNAIMRGQLAEGAQISAQAMASLQDQAGTRTRMKARFIESALSQFGYQLMWNMRDAYPSEFTTKIVDPLTGEPKDVKWEEDKAGDDYAVIINAGSSLPGAKQSAGDLMLRLHREGIVDGLAVLEAYGVSNAAGLWQRNRSKAMEDIESQAAGKVVGLQIKERIKPDGDPGRKQLE